MPDNSTKDRITELVISQTVKKNIPTLLLLSEISGSELVKTVISILLKKPYDEDLFTSQDWDKLSDIMLKLSEIPLVIKEITDIKLSVKQAEDFFSNITKSNGLVIVNCNTTDYPDFLGIKNISCKMLQIN